MAHQLTAAAAAAATPAVAVTTTTTTHPGPETLLAGFRSAMPSSSGRSLPATYGDDPARLCREALRERIADLALHLYPQGRRIGPDWCVGDATGIPGSSFKIALTGKKAGLHGDFATGEKHSASPLDLWMKARGVDFPTALREATDWLGHAPLPAPARPPRPRPATPARKPAPERPAMEKGTLAEWAELARRRGLDPAACQVASSVGWLRFGRWQGARAWFIVDTEGRNGQARRLDGQPWADGRKAWTFKGARAAWPIGLKEAEHAPALLLVEGGPDLLAALHFMHLQRDYVSWCPIAMLGAKMPIPEEALDRLRGRRARIYMHADPEGHGAAGHWTAQLRGRGFTVDCVRFDGLLRADGQPVNDLNDAALLAPGQAAELEGLLP